MANCPPGPRCLAALPGVSARVCDSLWSDVYLNHSNRCQHYSALSRDTCHEADNNVNVRMSGRSLSAAICQQSSLGSNQNRSVHRIWIPVVTPDCRRQYIKYISNHLWQPTAIITLAHIPHASFGKLGQCSNNELRPVFERHKMWKCSSTLSLYCNQNSSIQKTICIVIQKSFNTFNILT